MPNSKNTPKKKGPKSGTYADMKSESESIKIEKNVAFEIKPDGRGKPNKYPFESMKGPGAGRKFGDSFWYETLPNNLMTAARAWTKRNGFDWKWYALAEKNDAGVLGTRIWRTK